MLHGPKDDQSNTVYTFRNHVRPYYVCNRNTSGPYRRWDIVMHDHCICIGRQQQNRTPHNFVLTLCSSWTIRDYLAALVAFSPSIDQTLHRMRAIYSNTISFVRSLILHRAHPVAFANDEIWHGYRLPSPSPYQCKKHKQKQFEINGNGNENAITNAFTHKWFNMLR